MHKKSNNMCPSEYAKFPVVSGDYDMDKSISLCTNKDIPARIKLYALTDETGYGPRTGYQGYSGYSGDD